MKDTGKINILKKLAEIADDLDIKGFRKEANAVTNVMVRVSQQAKPNYFALADLPADGSGYSGAADQNEKLRAAISKQHNVNFPDFYSAYQKAFGTFTNNMEDRKKNLRGDIFNSSASVANPTTAPASNQPSPAANPTTAPASNQPSPAANPTTAPASNQPSPAPKGVSGDIKQTQGPHKFLEVNGTSRKKNSIFIKTSQGAQDQTIQHLENAIINDIIPRFRSTKLSYDNCYRFSGNPWKQYETLKYGHEFLDEIQEIVTIVNNLLKTNKLTKANQENFKEAVFGEHRKDSPFAKVSAIRQIAINVSDFAMGTGAYRDAAPKLTARAEGLMKQMLSV